LTEQEWETSRNPAAMVAYMDSRASARRRRLFPCACVRRVWSQLTDPRSRAAVETAERFADGLATEAELRAAHAAADALVFSFGTSANEAAAAAARDVAAPEVEGALFSPFNSVPRRAAEAARFEAMRRAVARGKMQLPPGSREAEQAAQADLGRCIFGSPFREPFVVSPTVLSHNDDVVVKLATVIFNERDPASGELDTSRLAILADALEEAGVDDQAALDHLRGRGPHARGCHALDACLGKT
jgi:hypothetical protein